MNRRMLIKLGALVPLAGIGRAQAAPAPTLATVESWRTDWKQWLAPNADVAASAKPPLVLSDAEWEKRLPPASYRVLRQSGTEYPGTSPLNHETRKGVFVCAGCSLPSFTSAMKFDSGTGWPSFVTSIPDAFTMGEGSKSVFVGLEVHCAKCGGHHGHIFNDGPKPLGDRWCINGVSLRFIPYA